MPKLDLTEELNRLAELSEKATEGEWKVNDHSNDEGCIYLEAPGVGVATVFTDDMEHNSAFIAALVNFFRAHAPALLEAQRDAGRYRWLNQTSNQSAMRINQDEMSIGIVFHARGPWEPEHFNKLSERLDAAIDAKLRGGES